MLCAGLTSATYVRESSIEVVMYSITYLLQRCVGGRIDARWIANGILIDVILPKVISHDAEACVKYVVKGLIHKACTADSYRAVHRTLYHLLLPRVYDAHEVNVLCRAVVDSTVDRAMRHEAFQVRL